MAKKIKLKVKRSGDVVDVMSLAVHPMETGSRKDPESGELIPAHHITQITFRNNDRTVLSADLSTAVSRDPFFGFKYSGAKAGDTLHVSWIDNLGESSEVETVLK